MSKAATQVILMGLVALPFVAAAGWSFFLVHAAWHYCATWIGPASPVLVTGLVSLWLGGALVRLIPLFVSQWRIEKNWRIVAADPDTDIFLVPGPFVWAATVGIFRPRIVLSTGLQQEAPSFRWQTIVAHETYHRTHHHPAKRYLLQILTGLYWPLPIVDRVANHLALLWEMEADRHAARTAGAAELRQVFLSLMGQAASPLLPGETEFGRDDLPTRLRALEHPGWIPSLPRSELFPAMGLSLGSLTLVAIVAGACPV